MRVAVEVEAAQRREAEREAFERRPGSKFAAAGAKYIFTHGTHVQSHT